jgi:drug/metabolite transporter (DMT)-like permease
MLAQIEYARAPLAMAAGVSYALIGVSYRLGQQRRIQPAQVLLALCLVAGSVFAIRSFWFDRPGPPAYVWGIGAAAGVLQYLAIKLVGVALNRGPLSPLWCALSLSFITPVVYSRLMLNEALSPPQYAGFACAVACMVAGSWQGGRQPGQARLVSPAQQMVYGLVLLATMLTNSGMFLGMKVLASRTLADGATYIDAFGGWFSLGLYMALGGTILLDQIVTGSWREIRRPLVWLGLLAGAGSIGGMTLVMAASSLPAAVVFTLSSVMSICTVAVASVLLLGERASLTWVATIVLGVLTAVLLNLRF